MEKNEKKGWTITIVITIIAWAVSIYVVTMPQEYWRYYRGIGQTVLELVAVPCIVVAGFTSMIAATTVIGLVLCMIIRIINVIRQ